MDDIEKMIAESEKEVEDNIAQDNEKQERLKEQKCTNCFYNSFFGFSAMTTTYCKRCDREMGFGSSDVDTYCDSCANFLGKCKRCGKPMD